MTRLVKALLPGTVVTYLVAGALGHNQSDGGFLNVYLARSHELSLYWSWPLMGAATALFWAIGLLMAD